MCRRQRRQRRQRQDMIVFCPDAKEKCYIFCVIEGRHCISCIMSTSPDFRERFISWKTGFQNPSKFEKIAFFIIAENALVWIGRNTIEISQFFWLWRNMVFVWTCISYAKQFDQFFSDGAILKSSALPSRCLPLPTLGSFFNLKFRTW